MNRAANLAPIRMIARRELRDQLRDWRIIAPVVLLTVFFPWLLNITAARLSTWLAQYGGDLIGERLVPFLLLLVGFFPATISLVIALESFVGEKERHSIEPLLSSPLEDWQLYLGKLAASLTMPILAGYLGTIVYILGIRGTIGWTPPPVLFIQVILLVTTHAVVMVSGAVVVSTQTTSARAANLLASFIVLPMALLIEGESLVMFYANYPVLWYSILAQLIVAALLIRMGVTHFNREELLGRELDTINLPWLWRVLRKEFVGKAHSLREWLFQEIPQTLRRMALPAVVVTALLIGAGVVGSMFAEMFPVGQALTQESIIQSIEHSAENMPLLSDTQVHVLWYHNVRVVALATLSGLISFGILGLIIIMLPMFLIGFFWSMAAQSGLAPWLATFALVGPHGLLEIPALILAGAAILRLGAVMVAPARGRTVGEAWLSALADWARIVLVFVIPLLLGAALIEIFITPRAAVWLLGG